MGRKGLNNDEQGKSANRKQVFRKAGDAVKTRDKGVANRKQGVTLAGSARPRVSVAMYFAERATKDK